MVRPKVKPAPKTLPTVVAKPKVKPVAKRLTNVVGLVRVGKPSVAVEHSRFRVQVRTA